MANDSISKSWFIVFNNPQVHGYEGTPEEICNRLKTEWIGDSETRSGAWAYCISDKGLHHVHMVLEDCKAMRFSLIKNSFCKGCHIEETKGNKKQALDYIHKRGVFSEKGESIEYICYHGEIQGKQGSRSDLNDVYKRLESGESPNDIIQDSPKLYVRLPVIRQMYYDIRSRKTPIVRPVKVYWHTGPSGSGKSYERINLSKLYGEDNIYYLTAFNSGAFDCYCGQPVLWIEDFRGEFKLQELLRMLDVYKAELPARFYNVKALWEEVHITSILTPQQCYPKSTRDSFDSIDQLLRRITSVVYHYKSPKGNYYQACFEPNTLLIDMQREVEKLSYVQDNYLAVQDFGDFDDYVDILDDSAEGGSPSGLPSAHTVTI